VQSDSIASSAVQARLFSLRDERYRSFQSKLIPSVDPALVIGVRMPLLRQLARELRHNRTDGAFLDSLPHTYCEENNLHALLLSEISDFDTVLAAVNRFLPFVDNWATCDSLRPRAFKNGDPRLDAAILQWLSSPHPYTLRFAIEMRMLHFLGSSFSVKYHAQIASIRKEEYYVKMMVAWYFATALAFQWESTLPYLAKPQLDEWVARRAIQKAIESNRISNEQKALLREIRATL